ncbi:MAG TPA: transcriptional regulator [Streptosporangiaceae bacterium]|nr:transcriptional regulator [Streptosporangiaceae bacterium]
MTEPEDQAGRRQSASEESRHGHPAMGLDEVVHQRTRLGILAVLAEAGQADFPYLRSLLELTDGNLGRHLQVLEEAGLIMISKGYHRRRPRTLASITGDGRRALGAELATLRMLMTRLEATGSSGREAASNAESLRG